MSERPAGSFHEFSSPAPFLFLVRNTSPVRFGTTAPVPGTASTDRFTQAFQPHARPREFNTKNREPNGYGDNRRPRRYDHHNAQQQYRHANDTDHDAASRPVGEVHDSFDQYLSRCS